MGGGPYGAVNVDALSDHLVDWGALWGVPTLEQGLSIRISSRLRASLGSYRGDRSQITIAAWLLEGPESLLEEVLCHEAAHAAAHALYTGGVRPHGVEWRELMESAGFAPRVRLPRSCLPKDRRVPLVQRGLWEHRCPVCQAVRMARTRVGRWRCKSCLEQGYDGHLVVVRRRAETIGIDS